MAASPRADGARLRPSASVCEVGPWSLLLRGAKGHLRRCQQAGLRRGQCLESGGPEGGRSLWGSARSAARIVPTQVCLSHGWGPGQGRVGSGGWGPLLKPTGLGLGHRSRSTPGAFHTWPRTARARAGRPVAERALLAQDSPPALPTARPHPLRLARPLPRQANAPRPGAAPLAKATGLGSLTTAQVLCPGGRAGGPVLSSWCQGLLRGFPPSIRCTWDPVDWSLRPSFGGRCAEGPGHPVCPFSSLCLPLFLSFCVLRDSLCEASSRASLCPCPRARGSLC